MNGRMKVMIAYDGSGYADAAIDDLRRAGLPPQGEALIVSVTDISKTAIADSDELGVLGKFVSSRLLEETVALTQRETARVMSEAKKLAIRGGERFLSNFPGWRVDSQTLVGNPAEELLRTANGWKPDLIVVGSHGRGAIGRFFLGSVSKKVAEDADCSVRVARRGFDKTSDAPNKIIVGASSLPDAEVLIQAIGRRVWSDETEARLVAVDDGVSANRVSAVYPYAAAIFEQAAEDLRAAGLKISVDIKSGNLKSVLLEEAENWEADSIFVVADDANEDSSLNETATSLITDATCTIEIARQICRRSESGTNN